MKILVYMSTAGDVWDKFKESVLDHLPLLETEVVYSINHLVQELRRPLHGVSVVVIFPAGEDEVQTFLQERELFDNLRLIVVLADEHRAVVSAALQLQPSYISYLDNNFVGMEAVLAKILTHSCCHQQVEYPG